MLGFTLGSGFAVVLGSDFVDVVGLTDVLGDGTAFVELFTVVVGSGFAGVLGSSLVVGFGFAVALVLGFTLGSGLAVVLGSSLVVGFGDVSGSGVSRSSMILNGGTATSPVEERARGSP